MSCVESAQTEELEAIKKAFPKCKIITNVGQFSHVVELKTDGTDLALKLQLEESYPQTVPGILVKSGILSAEQRAFFMEELINKAESLKGEQMLHQLYDTGLELAAHIGVDLTTVTMTQNAKPKSQGRGDRKKGGKANNKAQEGHVRGSKKLAAMKTSEDVISRILWDEALPSEHFTVGYLDRFVGVVERAFTAFSWEDLASVDYDVLAIPKHRIQYFKYKGIKVWDKEQRLDNMFGSTGSGLTIVDIIAQYEAGEIVAPSEEEKDRQPNTEQHDSDSDDEDIVIKTGLEGEGSTTTYPREVYWGPKKRPTHFLCLRVTDQSVRDVVQGLQERILEAEPLYAENIIPPDRLHITLACLGLDSTEDISSAAQLLHSIQPELSALEPHKIKIQLQDTDNFFNSVLYARVQHNSDLLAFVHKLRLLIQESGVEIRDVFEFVPHMTLLKLKRNLQKEMRTRYLESRVYELAKGVTFGEQVVDNVYLCEMSENRDEVGFYITPTHITF